MDETTTESRTVTVHHTRFNSNDEETRELARDVRMGAEWVADEIDHTLESAFAESAVYVEAGHVTVDLADVTPRDDQDLDEAVAAAAWSAWERGAGHAPDETRSMATGDVLEVDGRHFYADNIGFVELEFDDEDDETGDYAGERLPRTDEILADLEGERVGVDVAAWDGYSPGEGRRGTKGVEAREVDLEAREIRVYCPHNGERVLPLSSVYATDLEEGDRVRLDYDSKYAPDGVRTTREGTVEFVGRGRSGLDRVGVVTDDGKSRIVATSGGVSSREGRHTTVGTDAYLERLETDEGDEDDEGDLADLDEGDETDRRCPECDGNVVAVEDRVGTDEDGNREAFTRYACEECGAGGALGAQGTRTGIFADDEGEEPRPDGGRSRCSECGAVLPEELEEGTGVYCTECGTGQMVTDGGRDRPAGWELLERIRALEEDDPVRVTYVRDRFSSEASVDVEVTATTTSRYPLVDLTFRDAEGPPGVFALEYDEHYSEGTPYNVRLLTHDRVPDGASVVDVEILEAAEGGE